MRRIALLLAVLALSASVGLADTIAYEGFDYTYTAADADPLNGAAGGMGWSAAWVSTPNNATMGAGGYIYSPNMGYTGLASTGKAVKIGRDGWSQPGGNDDGAVATRTLDLSGVSSSLLSGGKLGADGSTVWFAFTGYGNGWFDGNTGNRIGLSLTDGGTSTLSIASSASPSGQWVLTPNIGTDANESAVFAHGATQHLFVGKVDFAAGNESVTVWGDPDISGAAPTGGTQVVNASFPSFTFDGVRLESNRNDGVPRFDEIRVGTDFASVKATTGGPPPPPPPPSKAIGVNYVNGAFGSASSLAPNEAAGYSFVQQSWNNVQGVGQGPPVTPVASLLDNNGNPTTANLTAWTLATNNSWRVDTGGSLDPNARLNSDFSDTQPTITIDGIPFSEYEVFVYYNNNEGPSRSTLTLTGTIDDFVSRLIETGNTGNTRWFENGYILEDGTLVGPSNVTLLAGLNDPGFTLALTGLNNNGITAIQIVSTAPEGEIPEPVTMALVGLGAAAACSYIRRRRRA